MKNFLLILTLFFTHITVSWANLYSCVSPKGKPSKIRNEGKTNLFFSNSAPIFRITEVNVENLNDKVPYLIYYAIDSSEAFMQYSVRYEIAKLIESCKKNQKVQFAAVLNSLYVSNNQILICKDKIASYINLSKYPELNQKLNLKRKFISSGDHTEDDNGPLRYLVKYFEETNKPFGKYPLAHPDFLYDLVNFISTNSNLFPSTKYAPYINLKSHGSKDHVLAGMHECQEKAKELTAKKIIETILDKKEVKTLKRLNTPEKVLENLSEYEKILSKIDLGKDRGVGSFEDKLGNERLGNERLGNERLGNERLGTAVSGLGVNQGLGADLAFGTAHVHLNWVLQDLYESGSKNTLGFLMLESCDTNRYPELFHSYLENILGYYTAKQSLWYRNLNWWDILERANGSTRSMFEILRDETPKIPNIESVTK